MQSLLLLHLNLHLLHRVLLLRLFQVKRHLLHQVPVLLQAQVQRLLLIRVLLHLNHQVPVSTPVRSPLELLQIPWNLRQRRLVFQQQVRNLRLSRLLLRVPRPRRFLLNPRLNFLADLGAILTPNLGK